MKMTAPSEMLPKTLIPTLIPSDDRDKIMLPSSGILYH